MAPAPLRPRAMMSRLLAAAGALELSRRPLLLRLLLLAGALATSRPRLLLRLLLLAGALAMSRPLKLPRLSPLLAGALAMSRPLRLPRLPPPLAGVPTQPLLNNPTWVRTPPGKGIGRLYLDPRMLTSCQLRALMRGPRFLSSALQLSCRVDQQSRFSFRLPFGSNRVERPGPLISLFEYGDMTC